MLALLEALYHKDKKQQQTHQHIGAFIWPLNMIQAMQIRQTVQVPVFFSKQMCLCDTHLGMNDQWNL